MSFRHILHIKQEELNDGPMGVRQMAEILLPKVRTATQTYGRLKALCSRTHSRITMIKPQTNTKIHHEDQGGCLLPRAHDPHHMLQPSKQQGFVNPMHLHEKEFTHVYFPLWKDPGSIYPQLQTRSQHSAAKRQRRTLHRAQLCTSKKTRTGTRDPNLQLKAEEAGRSHRGLRQATGWFGIKILATGAVSLPLPKSIGWNKFTAVHPDLLLAWCNRSSACSPFLPRLVPDVHPSAC